MFARLSQNWVYGGALAGILLLVLAPLVVPGLGLAGGLVSLALALYMLRQMEEHDTGTTVALGPVRRPGHVDLFTIQAAIMRRAGG